MEMNHMHETVQSLLELSGNDAFPHASELHGLLCAHACVAPAGDFEAHAGELLAWLGENDDAALRRSAAAALAHTNRELLDSAGPFQPLLPADDTPLAERTEALGAWAGAYVSGLGVHPTLTLRGDAREAWQDLQQIARAGLEAGAEAAEQDERAYAEVVEYLRVAVQLIHHALLPADAEAAPPATRH
jgi:uncharacterized protein YgfB (UPF0149 family)